MNKNFIKGLLLEIFIILGIPAIIYMLFGLYLAFLSFWVILGVLSFISGFKKGFKKENKKDKKKQ